MPEPIFNDRRLRALAMGLDGLAVRQRTIANNIANVDTPNYKAQKVNFEAQLQRTLAGGSRRGLEMKTTQLNHLGAKEVSGSPSITVDSRPNTLRNDGNNVDIDLEMTDLAETAMRYQALAQLTAAKLTALKTLIRESR
jgi:flagellar basal-body rod protein FlgB